MPSEACAQRRRHKGGAVVAVGAPGGRKNRVRKAARVVDHVLVRALRYPPHVDGRARVSSRLRLLRLHRLLRLPRLLRPGHVGAIAPEHPVKLAVDQRHARHGPGEREDPIGEGVAGIDELALRAFGDAAECHEGLHHVAAGGLWRAAPDAEQVPDQLGLGDPSLVVAKAAGHVVGQHPAPQAKVLGEEHGRPAPPDKRADQLEHAGRLRMHLRQALGRVRHACRGGEHQLPDPVRMTLGVRGGNVSANGMAEEYDRVERQGGAPGLECIHKISLHLVHRAAMAIRQGPWRPT